MICSTPIMMDFLTTMKPYNSWSIVTSKIDKITKNKQINSTEMPQGNWWTEWEKMNKEESTLKHSTSSTKTSDFSIFFYSSLHFLGTSVFDYYTILFHSIISIKSWKILSLSKILNQDILLSVFAIVWLYNLCWLF